MVVTYYMIDNWGRQKILERGSPDDDKARMTAHMRAANAKQYRPDYKWRLTRTTTEDVPNVA